jgi:O-acetyl-ADP-ribose deacetylase (regulator of RNase III)
MNQDTTQSNPPALSAKQLQQGVRSLAERIREWWRREGLGHTSEVSVTEGGNLLVKFSCSGSSLFDLLDDEALSEKEYEERVLARFKQAGFRAIAIPGDGIQVLACDESSAALKALLASRFPSSVIMGTETRVLGYYDDAFVMMSVHILIREIDEVLALPAPVGKA